MRSLLGGGDLVYAAVNDNVVTSELQLAIGEAAPGEPQTLFDWFRKVWLTLSKVDTNTAQLADKIEDMSKEMASMKSLIKSQNATVGGGCYFTIYSKDYPFLDTFKVRVTDGTSTKSSYINYNEDSEYYAAELRVPTTSSKVDVFILDPETNEEQVKLTAKDVDTTSGYANIDLDPLFASAYATPLEKNTKLATVMYKSSIVTQNTSWLPTICNNLANHQEHFQDFLLSCAGLTVASQNFEQLYANVSEFLSVVASNAGSWLLANSTFGTDVANSLPLLQVISSDNAFRTKCNNISQFREYIVSTGLPLLEQKLPGGQLNEVFGNLLVISVTSGSRGKTVLTGYNCIYSNGDYERVQTHKAYSCRPSIDYKLMDNTISLLNAMSSLYDSGYIRDYVNMQWTTTPWANGYDFSCCATVPCGLFVDSLTIATLTEYSPTADSVITYIDLDVVD